MHVVHAQSEHLQYGRHNIEKERAKTITLHANQICAIFAGFGKKKKGNILGRKKMKKGCKQGDSNTLAFVWTCVFSENSDSRFFWMCLPKSRTFSPLSQLAGNGKRYDYGCVERYKKGEIKDGQCCGKKVKQHGGPPSVWQL